MKIAETVLAIAITCFVFHGPCQGQESPDSGPAQSSDQPNSALFDMQQKLNDMRDQLAAQKASSSLSIWTLFDMRQKLNDMRDQLAAQKASSSLSNSTLFDMRQKLNDMRDQIQFRAEQMRINLAEQTRSENLVTTHSMKGLALKPGFEMHDALAAMALGYTAQAFGESAKAIGENGTLATILFAIHNMGIIYAISKGWESPTKAPFVGYALDFFGAVPDTFNPSPCDGSSCRASSWYRIIQTPHGSSYWYQVIQTPLGSSYSNQAIETPRATTVTKSSTSDALISPPPVTPPSDTRQPSPKPVVTINGCRISDNVPCSPPSNYNRDLGSPRPPPNFNRADGGDGGDGGRGARTDNPAGIDMKIRPVPAGEVPAGLAQSVIDSRKGCTTAACGIR